MTPPDEPASDRPAAEPGGGPVQDERADEPCGEPGGQPVQDEPADEPVQDEAAGEPAGGSLGGSVGGSAGEPVDGPGGESADDRPEAAVLAEPSQRLVARLVDTLIVGVPLATVAAEIFPRETAQRVVAPIAFAGVFLVYEALQLTLWGCTVGKRLTGLHVVSVDGSRLRPSQAIVRSLIYALPPAARPVPVLNVLAGIFWIAEIGLLFEGAHRQALHDRAAGTLVVDTRPRPARVPDPADPPPGTEPESWP